MKVKYVYGAIVVVVLLAGWLLWGGSGDRSDDGSSKKGVAGEPVDIALQYFSEWEKVLQSTSSDEIVIPNTDSISDDLAEQFSNPTEALARLYCGLTAIDRTRGKVLSEQPGRVELLILHQSGETRASSVAVLEGGDGVWLITDIYCGGDGAPPQQGEYTFDREGRVLKDNVPPPLNPQYWHLIFEENGVMGHTVPLLFDDSSVCIANDGSESICSDNSLQETKLIRAQGNMSEAGLEVKRIEIR